MKIITILCLATHCLAALGQTTKPPAPAKVSESYQRIVSKLAGLETKLVALDQAYRKDQRALAMKYRAGKLSPQKAAAKEHALAVTKQKKSAAVRKEAAALESQRFDIERRYALPVVTQLKPKLANPPTR
jgi:hypothetical protein